MLAHILGQCTYNKTERIPSHDELVDLFMAEIPKRNKETVVIKELRIKTNVDFESVGKNFCDSYQIHIRFKIGIILRMAEKRCQISVIIPHFLLQKNSLRTSDGEML